MLLTDLGYQQQQGLVWELLDSIDGNTTLVDSKFREASDLASTSNVYNAAIEFGNAFGQKLHSPSRHTSEEDDMRLAMQLQAQEDQSIGASYPPDNILAQQQAEYERLKKNHLAQRGAKNNKNVKKKQSCTIC